MENVYDIEWITHQDKSYKAARLLVAGGGPNIWVNLQDMTVDGYWGGDRVNEPFIDNIGLDDYLAEIHSYSLIFYFNFSSHKQQADKPQATCGGWAPPTSACTAVPS